MKMGLTVVRNVMLIALSHGGEKINGVLNGAVDFLVVEWVKMSGVACVPYVILIIGKEGEDWGKMRKKVLSKNLREEFKFDVLAKVCYFEII